MELHISTVLQILITILIAVIGGYMRSTRNDMKDMREDIKGVISKDLCEAHRKAMDEKIHSLEELCKQRKGQ